MLLQGRHSLRKTPAGRVWGDLIGFAKNHFSFKALLDLLAFSFGKLSWANAPLPEREAILPQPSLQLGLRVAPVSRWASRGFGGGLQRINPRKQLQRHSKQKSPGLGPGLFSGNRCLRRRADRHWRTRPCPR